jgi:hypothetical protein
MAGGVARACRLGCGQDSRARETQMRGGGGGGEIWTRKGEVIFYISNLNNGSLEPFSMGLHCVSRLLLLHQTQKYTTNKRDGQKGWTIFSHTHGGDILLPPGHPHTFRITIHQLHLTSKPAVGVQTRLFIKNYSDSVVLLEIYRYLFL